MKPEIKNIILECQKGNRDAQRKIYSWLSPRMFAICIRYTKNRMEAEDCLQEGFIKVFTKIDSYSFKGAFEGWVRKIIVNTIIESFRRKDLIDNKINIDDIDESYLNNWEENPTEINADLLNDLIMELPQQYRIVFSMYVIEEFTHEEIARQLNISIGTSKSNLSRARKWLQNRINKLNLNEIIKYVKAS